MPIHKPIPVVDLFAGPGGLGEGFSQIADGKGFKTIVSVEMERSAHQTLVLRSFYRILKRRGNDALNSYYKFCNGQAEVPWDKNTADAWKEAEQEARCVTLGTSAGNRELHSALKRSGIGQDKPWVLIGGPPCQAYSLVGRARNRGIADYKANDDHRHFLYKEYLKIIQRYQPSVFVMENVKGILSSQVNDKSIFPIILRDLSAERAGRAQSRGYRIHSLVQPTVFDRHTKLDDIDANDFVIRSENFGIPQARHRVILLGVREDIDICPRRLSLAATSTVKDAISDLPRIRSRISNLEDSPESWANLVTAHLDDLMNEAATRVDLKKLAAELKSVRRRVGRNPSYGRLRMDRASPGKENESALAKWYSDDKLSVWLNHEARGHMPTDLRRYLFAATFAKAFGRSPKGHQEFDLRGLRPAHKNWESGKFADRFRVQLEERPATTITSHIAKDGHYFIHPDPSQCRSLTVREAARLQTFPDNYFFMGNRTQQYHQVGNAVPPMLAAQIAQVVYEMLG
jgi:DNA (cytosine-5)-methyltransferase 1